MGALSQFGVGQMDSSTLCGRSILVIEEEPIVALRLEDRFYRAGATVFGASELRAALHLAEYPALSAAVVNLKLGDDKTTAVCDRLCDLGVPFMFYTRYDATDARRTWPDAPVVSKPADSSVVVRALAAML
jgi:DNA-binding response OmpR family regulator